MKMLAWYRVDVAFKLRMAFLGEKLSYEERLQRMEELVWMRDEVKNLIEEKEYEPSVQESANESTTAPEPEKLVRGETPERSGSQAHHGWINTSGSGGCCQSGKCTFPKDR